MKYASKLPVVIFGIKGIIDRVKGASAEDKRRAIIESISDSVALAEFTAGKDLLQDAEVAKLLNALLEAEQVVADARAALKAMIIKKGPEIA